MTKLKELVWQMEYNLNTLAGSQAAAAQLQLAKWYNYIDSNRTLYYSNQILATPTATTTNDVIIQARLSAAVAQLSNRKVTEAIALVKEAEDMACSAGNTHLMAAAAIYNLMLCPYNNAILGNELITTLENNPEIQSNSALKCQYHQSASDFFRESDLPKAGVHLFEALSYSKQLQQPWIEGTILCKLGMLAERKQDLDAAIGFYNDAEKLLVTHGCTQYVFQAQICMSKLMLTKKDYPQAITYAQQAYATAATIQFKSGMDFATMHHATALLWQKRIDEAEPIVLALVQHGTDQHMQGSLLNMLSNLYVQKNDLHKGIEYALQSYALRKENIRPQDELSHHEKMYKLYVRTENYKEAFQYFELFHNRTMMLANQANVAVVAEMETKYNTEKREAELQKIKLQQAESELKALKAQMNPHFIFNSLNSIQEVFFTGNKTLANEHLSRFSQLMRNILKASGRNSITLHEEIEMLNEYLALEALRIGDTFTYSITLSEGVDVFTMEIPPMILQPFIENAVKHGLQHKQGAKNITITFNWQDENQTLICLITDNGIGRQASAKINEKRTGHNSFSTSATTRRFDMLNSASTNKFEYHYTDNTDAQGSAAGTTVTISIPVD